MAITGYLLTISLETPVLIFGLAKVYSLKEKVLAGISLTAFSYPFVAVIFPLVFDPYEHYGTYILVSEVFAPLSEIALFTWLFQKGKELKPKERFNDFAVIVAANLLSYLTGELLRWLGIHLV